MLREAFMVNWAPTGLQPSPCVAHSFQKRADAEPSSLSTAAVHTPGGWQCSPERKLRPFRDAPLNKPLFVRPDELSRAAGNLSASGQEVAVGVAPHRSRDVEDTSVFSHHSINGELREVPDVHGLKVAIEVALGPAPARPERSAPTTRGDAPRTREGPVQRGAGWSGPHHRIHAGSPSRIPPSRGRRHPDPTAVYLVHNRDHRPKAGTSHPPARTASLDRRRLLK